jgi:hypothetical protein
MDEQQPTAPESAPQEPTAQSAQTYGKGSRMKMFVYYLIAAVVIYFLVWFLWLK